MHGPRVVRAWIVAVQCLCPREGKQWFTVWSRVGHKRITNEALLATLAPPTAHPQTSDMVTTSAIATNAISNITAIAIFIATAIATAVAITTA